jgi:hypothetical protein
MVGLRLLFNWRALWAKVRPNPLLGAQEETALRAGVAKHGLGAWEIIRKDPAFSVLRCLGRWQPTWSLVNPGTGEPLLQLAHPSSAVAAPDRPGAQWVRAIVASFSKQG